MALELLAMPIRANTTTVFYVAMFIKIRKKSKSTVTNSILVSARNRDASDNDDELGAQDNDEGNRRQPDFDDVVRAEPIYNTELTWRVGRWHLRANYAYLDYEQELDSGEIDDTLGEVDDVWPRLNDFFEEFSLKDELHYYALGASWEHEGWQVR